MQPLQNCIGPTIHIGRESCCLPYAGIFWKASLIPFVESFLSTESLISDKDMAFLL